MKFKKDTKIKDVDSSNFRFTQKGRASFSQDGDSNQVRMRLYNGRPNKHWYWGNMSFDLSGMKLAADSIPILSEHDTNKRLGFSTGASFDGEFVLDGELLGSSPLAAEFRRDAADGFPFESSLTFDEKTAKIKFVKDGETVEVNGHQLEGPGTVFEQSTIREGSICVLGALENTKSVLFNQENADKLKRFAEENAEVYDLAFSAGEAAGLDTAQQTFAKFTDEFGKHPAFIIEQFAAGKTLEAARAEYCQFLSRQLAETKSQLATQQAENEDPAVQAFSDEAGRRLTKGEGGGGETDEDDTVEQTEDIDKEVAACADAKYKEAKAAGRITIVANQNKNVFSGRK